MLVSGSPRGTLLPAPLARRTALPPPSVDGVDRDILDYADFVLDQEARYCQQ